MTDPLRVLFVCTANTCRSPFMELLTEHLAGDDLTASSAGTHASAGRPVTGAMADQLAARGVAPDAIRRFRSRPLSRELVAGVDVVVTAEPIHRRTVLDRHPVPGPRVLTLGWLADEPDLEVTDPFGHGPADHAACAARIESLLRVALPALGRSGRIPAWSS